VALKIDSSVVSDAMNRLKDTGIGEPGIKSWVVTDEIEVFSKPHYIFNNIRNGDYIIVAKEKPNGKNS